MPRQATSADPVTSPSRSPDRPAPADAEELVERYYAHVYRLAWSILDDGAEAEDAAQATLIAAARGLPGYRGEAAFTTWLYRIAVNVCRGHLRKRRARQGLTDRLRAEHQANPAAPPPELSAISSESDRELWAAVDGLDEKHRLPIVLRYVHDLTVPEIARVLQISEGTVHSRLHYARAKLRRCLVQPPVGVNE